MGGLFNGDSFFCPYHRYCTGSFHLQRKQYKTWLRRRMRHLWKPEGMSSEARRKMGRGSISHTFQYGLLFSVRAAFLSFLCFFYQLRLYFRIGPLLRNSVHDHDSFYLTMQLRFKCLNLCTIQHPKRFFTI